MTSSYLAEVFAACTVANSGRKRSMRAKRFTSLFDATRRLMRIPCQPLDAISFYPPGSMMSTRKGTEPMNLRSRLQPAPTLLRRGLACIPDLAFRSLSPKELQLATNWLWLSSLCKMQA